VIDEIFSGKCQKVLGKCLNKGKKVIKKILPKMWPPISEVQDPLVFGSSIQNLLLTMSCIEIQKRNFAELVC